MICTFGAQIIENLAFQSLSIIPKLNHDNYIFLESHYAQAKYSANFSKTAAEIWHQNPKLDYFISSNLEDYEAIGEKLKAYGVRSLIAFKGKNTEISNANSIQVNSDEVLEMQEYMLKNEGMKISYEAAIDLAAVAKLSKNVDKGSTICIILKDNI